MTTTTTKRDAVTPVVLHSGAVIYLPKAELDAMTPKQLVKMMRRFDRAAVRSFGRG